MEIRIKGHVMMEGWLGFIGIGVGIRMEDEVGMEDDWVWDMIMS